ncbi:MAG: hypothetical protein V2I27_02745 [Erythrobacter sp.]|jgi:chromosome segregation ATPase|nr:hypothetical protein [Erythrobacter sp.]
MISLSKWIGKSSAGIEPMSEKDPPFLAASRANRAGAPGRVAGSGRGGSRLSASKGAVAGDKPAPPPEHKSALASGTSREPPSERAGAEAPLVRRQASQSRAEALKQHLDATLERVQHARADADQLFALICDLEAEARQSGELGVRNEELSRRIEEGTSELAHLSESNAELSAELARLRLELERTQAARDEAQKEASAHFLACQRELERKGELAGEISLLRADLEGARAATEAVEVDRSSLRAILAERENALRALQMKEAELRMAGEKDAGHIAELTRGAQRKDARIIELGSLNEKNDRRIEQLEERYECALEEQRQLEVRHRDLQIATESRIYSLTSSLSQEQAGHRVTRKLLDEQRASSQLIADENKQLKDQALALAQENQQMKIELGGTRGTIREYGERLSELNLRYGAAQDDVERLEAALGEARKEARTLKRRAAKVDDLQSENAGLHDKISSMQNMLDQYRGGRHLHRPGQGQVQSEEPILLTSRRASAALPSACAKGAREEKPSATITPLPRAQ